MPLPTSFVVKNGSKIRGCTLLGHARPVVVDLEDDGVVARGRASVRRTSVPRPLAREHRLLGVDDQVEQDLLELVRIGEDLRQAGGQRLDDR